MFGTLPTECKGGFGRYEDDLWRVNDLCFGWFTGREGDVFGAVCS